MFSSTESTSWHSLAGAGEVTQMMASIALQGGLSEFGGEQQNAKESYLMVYALISNCGVIKMDDD